MAKVKIFISIMILAILFIASLILQSKYNSIILDATNSKGVESLVAKQIVILGSSFAFLNILIGSIVFCFSVMFAILVFVLINRKKMERRAKIKEKLTMIYQQLILDALEDKVIDKKELKKFKKICNSRFRRNIFINQIIDVALIMPKDLLGKLRDLYRDLGLIKETKRKLRSRHWHHKIKAIKELSHLDINEYNNTIMKYINSRNDTLRMEAQIAMVRLSSDENPFAFLTNLKHRFSLWEQITLHEQMVEANMRVPNFGEWLTSTNDDVVMFCLRMIREYNQTDNGYKIMTLIMNHPNSKLRKLAIEVLGDLKFNDATSCLIFGYHLEPYENKLETIRALSKIGNIDSFAFFKNVVENDDDTQLQIESVKGIKNLGEKGEEFLNQMLDTDYRNYNIIIKHVLDNRIN